MNALSSPPFSPAPLSLVPKSGVQPAAAAMGVHARAAMLFALALGYATLRYHLFKGVAWADWPTYTVNKAFGLVALALIVAGLVSAIRRRGSFSRPWLRLAGGALLIHALLSLLLLDPSYYPKFFVDGKLGFSAGLALLLGVLGAAAFHVSGRHAGQWSLARKLGMAGLIAFVGGCHAALPGWATWLQFAQWPGLMPPITLIAFLIGTAGGALALTGIRRGV